MGKEHINTGAGPGIELMGSVPSGNRIYNDDDGDAVGAGSGPNSFSGLPTVIAGGKGAHINLNHGDEGHVVVAGGGP